MPSIASDFWLPPVWGPWKSLYLWPVRDALLPFWLWKRRWPQAAPAANASRLLSMIVVLVPSRVARIVRTAGSPETDW